VGCDEFRSAQEIHAALGGSGTRVGLATVYRNLQAMVADGEVDVIRTAEARTSTALAPRTTTTTTTTTSCAARAALPSR